MIFLLDISEVIIHQIYAKPGKLSNDLHFIIISMIVFFVLGILMTAIYYPYRLRYVKICFFQLCCT